MKITSTNLETLLEIQSLTIESRKLEQSARELAKGSELENARTQLLDNSTRLSEARSKHEDILREIRRVEGHTPVPPQTQP